jgi:2-polyprenyl-3-methyl-5-hydroxy-6-metoxy-1,4-benzoquinol methylase
LKYSNYIEHYEKDAEVYDYLPPLNSKLGQAERRRAELLLRLADIENLPRNALILDIGAGGGQLVRIISRRGRQILGLDIPTRNLKRIRESLSSSLQKYFFPISADAYNLPLRPESVDAVFLSEVIEHLDDPATVLKEIRRAIKPGGSIILSCPYREQIVQHLCVHCNKPTPANAHMHSIDESYLQKILPEAGFRIVEFKHFNNRALSALGYPLLARRWNYGLWRAFDSLANGIYRKPLFIAAKARPV